MLKQIGEAPPAQQKVPLENLKALISSDPGTNAQQKTVLTAMIDRAVNAQPIAQSPTKFVQEFSQAFTRITAENAVASPFQASLQQRVPKNNCSPYLVNKGLRS